MDNTYGIQLRHPLSGDLVGRQLTVAAIGTAFEASYGWRLVTGQTTLASGFFQAGSMGQMEAFVYETAVSFTHLGRAMFQLFGDDPSGEHPPGLDLTEVSVILIPGMVGYQIHQVTAGETLFRIAREAGSTVDSIVAANELPNPDLIRIGQILRVPIM